MAANVGLSGAAYAQAYERLGSFKAVAKEMGVNESTARRAVQRLNNMDPAVSEAMAAIGTGMVPSVAWIKTKATEDAPGYSVMLRPSSEAPEDVTERVKAALDGLVALPEIPAPAYADDDLCTLYPIADVHIGMRAWGRETGEDYDTDKAAERLRSWVGQCVAASPASDTAIILDVGDLTHADDHTNQTPASKHALDVDTRHFRTLDVTIRALAHCIDLAAAKHRRVLVRILPGNHNITSYMAVMFALAERYRDNPRVEVQKEPGEFFVYEFGRVLLAAHHGDKAKADRLANMLADIHAPAWGRTLHRFLFTGHLHHHRSQDIGGVTWEQLRAVTARDAYAAAHAFSARAQLQAVTFHKERGEVSRVKVTA